MPSDLRASIFVADYIAVDGAGKLTTVGLGWSFASIDPITLLTPPMHVGVLVDVPAARIGSDFTFLLDLRRANGEVVQALGATGQPEALRIQQLVTPERNAPAGAVTVPRDVPSRIQAVFGFPTGLPLATGESYYWRLELDHKHLKGWEAHFHILAPPPTPVLGGPANPTDIPNVAGASTDEDDEES